MLLGQLAPSRAADDIGSFDISKVTAAAQQSPQTLAQDSAGLNQLGGKRKSENLLLVSLRIAGYLVLVLGVIFGLLWLIRKMGVAGANRPGGSSMDILEVLPFGQNRGIMLVRVMDKVLVLSQTAQQIQLLESIEGEKALELIASTKGGTSIVKFKDLFNSFVDKMKK
jgi:flagellar biosynthetic protein FliO